MPLGDAQLGVSRVALVGAGFAEVQGGAGQGLVLLRYTGRSRPGAGFAKVHRAEPAMGWFCQGGCDGQRHSRGSRRFAWINTVRAVKHGSRGETRLARLTRAPLILSPMPSPYSSFVTVVQIAQELPTHALHVFTVSLVHCPPEASQLVCQ